MIRAGRFQISAEISHHNAQNHLVFATTIQTSGGTRYAQHEEHNSVLAELGLSRQSESGAHWSVVFILVSFGLYVVLCNTVHYWRIPCH